MKEKELKSVAQAIADMATSSRIAGDLSSLVAAGKGAVSIDLLDHSEAKAPGELLRQWWKDQSSMLPLDRIVKALVILNYDLTDVPTNRDKIALFDLASVCKIKTKVREYVAKSENKVWWQADA